MFMIVFSKSLCCYENFKYVKKVSKCKLILTEFTCSGAILGVLLASFESINSVNVSVKGYVRT